MIVKDAHKRCRTNIVHLLISFCIDISNTPPVTSYISKYIAKRSYQLSATILRDNSPYDYSVTPIRKFTSYRAFPGIIYGKLLKVPNPYARSPSSVFPWSLRDHTQERRCLQNPDSSFHCMFNEIIAIVKFKKQLSVGVILFVWNAYVRT